MKHRARLFVIGAAPLAAAVGLFACSNDPKTSFSETEDAGRNAPEASAEASYDGGTDARVPFDGSDESVTCTAKPCVVELVAGYDHFCARLEDKTVRCWGNSLYALGKVDGGAASSVSRPLAMGLSGVTQISAGGRTTCARLADGTVKCFGGNWGNELAFDPPTSDVDPHDPATVTLDGGALDGFDRVDVGERGVVFARKTSGELWSWGDNTKFALGRPRTATYDAYLGPGPFTYLPTGVAVVRGGGVSTDSAIGSIAFLISGDGRLFAWGTAKQAIAYPGPVPVAVEGLENVSSAAITENNICAVADGHLYCWGGNGRLACTNTSYAPTSPVAIRTRGSAGAQQVSVGILNTCVRLTDGTIECCGEDTRGQLGRAEADAGVVDQFGPLLAPVSAFTGHAVQVAVASRTICALVQGGTVQCWGSNESGQLGQGTLDVYRHATPVTVQFD
ncbi:hypothetical protein AKJ09_06967 [Labilithrix luteola]|uniref:BNR repeat domain protein n=1 Tax=Labilithrix luteola TaxID=1391654 RepID=A0A0K1Q3G2_9BACT|nr:hypothetical protein [Labilithrix luteola]AKV00304.1 hypothetical protein AKJ09_06967 [Labilithrix luteola]